MTHQTIHDRIDFPPKLVLPFFLLGAFRHMEHPYFMLRIDLALPPWSTGPGVEVLGRRSTACLALTTSVAFAAIRPRDRAVKEAVPAVLLGERDLPSLNPVRKDHACQAWKQTGSLQRQRMPKDTMPPAANNSGHQEPSRYRPYRFRRRRGRLITPSDGGRGTLGSFARDHDRRSLRVLLR